MKLNKTLVRVLAVCLIAAMSVGLMGCVSSYNTDPLVAKAGNVKLYLSQYISLYNNTDQNTNPFYTYLQYGLIDSKQYAEYMLDELVEYGVQLDQLEVQNITLDSDEEAQLQKDVDEQIKSYVNTNYLSKVSEDITDENAKYEAALELFKAELKKNKSSFEKYRDGVEENLRRTARLNKLRDITVAGVSASSSDVISYVKDATKTDVTVSSFYSTWSQFLSMSTKAIPLYMPHPEKGVEDDPATEDKDETVEADPFKEFFSVKHLLIKFAETAGDDEEDLAAYGEKDNVFTEKKNEFEETLATLTSEQFLEKCFDSVYCDDPGMMAPTYQHFGYLMQESLLSSYYAGFGYASMKLRFGDEWKSDKEKAEPAEGEEPVTAEYDVEMIELADGVKIAKVYTTAGVHYIIINTEDAFCMYDEDGYVMIPVYENDEVVAKDNGILTIHDKVMTQEQLDAVNEAFSHIKAAPAEKEEGEEETEETEETEEAEPVTAKDIYDYFFETKLSSMKSEYYNEQFKIWKENTKIVKKENIIKAFYQG